MPHHPTAPTPEHPMAQPPLRTSGPQPCPTPGWPGPHILHVPSCLSHGWGCAQPTLLPEACPSLPACPPCALHPGALRAEVLPHLLLLCLDRYCASLACLGSYWVAARSNGSMYMRHVEQYMELGCRRIIITVLADIIVILSITICSSSPWA